MIDLIQKIEKIEKVKRFAKVVSVKGLIVGIVGANTAVGTRVLLSSKYGYDIPAEVIGFSEDITLVMPFYTTDGVYYGSKVRIMDSVYSIYPSRNWMGRVINAMAQPLDEFGALVNGNVAYPIRNNPIPANQRNHVGNKMDIGIKSINCFVPCCYGQRIGIFSSSGIGKSVMQSMIAKSVDADVIVIGLIGERGREVKEFINHDLGSDGLAKSVIIVSTSDETALMRRQAAYLTLTVAEYFRDLGLNVLCLMDSVTRFAMSQREIGLSNGEPPSSKAYPPSVFSELPRLLERAGPGKGSGNITGFFTVLVEGDDHNEPIADAVRSILDGHIVLDRKIAERGRYPAINILKSVSRMMPDCNTEEENLLIKEAKHHISLYSDMEDMICLGAYQSGSNPAVDTAISVNSAIEKFISQKKSEISNLKDDFMQLKEILGKYAKH